MEQNTKVSKFFSYGELWRSEGANREGIDNRPTPEHLDNLIWLAQNIADKCREYVGGPLHGSFYRSPALNAITPGASATSYHSFGMAVDLDCDHYGYGNNADLFRWMNRNLTFGQLIWEFGDDKKPDWIHVTAYRPNIGTFGLFKWDQKQLDRFYWENGQRKKKPFDLPL